MIRVVIADDHPVVRDGLRVLFSSLPDIELLAEAATGREAVRAAVTHQPHVLVMDLRMPDLDGVAATAEISRLAPDVAVLVLTMFDDDETVFAAMRAGARGYLVKGASQEDISRAITTVAGGGAVFGPGVARRVLNFFGNPSPTAQPPFPELTPREREVLDLIAAGLPNATIARRLGLAGKTVGNHISTIFAKLQVATRAEAIVRARDGGLGRQH
ncbi:DNA-binding response regulator [Longispora fulva]|uniref:DNA-binding NarL/FixJ family response regulator n=1 Tax=Longispora fulva TaxID=619741 RepID=A0A8J7KJG0_9ACTN|nr:response regulator transcription factor [Longispora fulva]MBG6135426.1 DNA-binding NarL/FixJ family response regulator [Longispora fulva]GIG56331.1 DNA-binding response regulator [Longispora fulva]